MTVADLLPAGATAIITNECQNGAIGPRALWGALGREAQPIVPNVVRLLGAARAREVPVIQFVAVRREDLRGANRNAPIFEAAARPGGLQLGTEAVELVQQLGPAPTDHIVRKTHGLASIRTTGADAILRNLGITTLVLTGVSLNVAIPSLAFEAVNLGYRVVIPRDAVAGVPPEFADDVLDHSLSLVAELLTTDEILAVWTS